MRTLTVALDWDTTKRAPAVASNIETRRCPVLGTWADNTKRRSSVAGGSRNIDMDNATGMRELNGSALLWHLSCYGAHIDGLVREKQ